MRNVAYLAGIVLTIAVAAHFAFAPSRAGTVGVWAFIAVPTLVLAALGCVRAANDGILKHWIGVRGGDFTRGFAAAGILFGASYAFMRVVAPPESPRSVWFERLYRQLGSNESLRKHVTWVVAGIIVVAIAEELLWRGLVISLLEELVGSRRAWVWAAVLYSLAHVPTAWALADTNGNPNPLVLVAALGAGLLWGGMARKFERLLPSVFSHVLFDWTVLMMFRLWGPSV